MNKSLAIIFFGMLALSCAKDSARSEQNLPTPTPDAYAFDGSKPTKQDERFPHQMQDVLESAERIQVYETELCTHGRGTELTPKDKGKFQGCKVLRQADLIDPVKRQQFVSEVENAINSHHSGNACFDPHHGIRAEHDGKRVELLICFECENFRGASTMGEFGGGFSPAVQKLFEKILSGSAK